MPRSFCASRSISMRPTSGGRPSTRNGFSTMLFAIGLANSRVETALARLAVVGKQLPQRLHDAAQLLGVTAIERLAAIRDELVRLRQVARFPDLRRGILEVELPRLGRAVECGRRQALREPHL